MAQHHPLGDIEYLRENLLNSYKLGFPILKELVQNAEDAKATRLDYGWIEGIPNAKHPLLRTPALFLLDNGEFTNENAKSIRYILGGSSKPLQQDSIGKFGLGLKSVFHLCEAFFYVAPKLENSTYSRWDIFNPWAGAENKDEYHDGWDDFSEEDKDKIRQVLHQLLSQQDYQKKWFILWIPLRQKSHCTREEEEDGIPLGWIKNGCYDFFEKIPDFFGSNETRKQLSLLLTLLGTVNKITYWENNLTQAKFEIKLNSDSKRRKSLSRLENNQENLIKGQISCDKNNFVEFAGSEVISESQKFHDILSSTAFPGKFKHIKPHNAIVFSHFNNRFCDTNKYLTLRTAVFLPVGKDKDIACKAKQSYCLTLHGYFFVDFARTGILGWDDNELRINAEKIEGDDSISVLKKSWNFHLYSILLSRFLNAFETFVSQYRLSTDEISAICESLYQSQLFINDSNRKRICENKQWVFCLNPQVNQKNSWALLDKKVRILSLPEVPEWNYFPSLKKIAESSEYALTLSNKPNLGFNGITSEPWADKEITFILSHLSETNLFQNHNAINYLVLFLQDSSQGKISDKVQNHLIGFIKKGLSKFKWTELNSQKKDALRKLVTLIHISQVIYIEVNESIFKHIIQIDTSVLVLPKSLFNNSNNNPSAQLNEQDVTAIFSKINQWINHLEQNGKNINILEPILRQFLHLSGNNIIQILSNNPDWRCLLGNPYPNEETQFYSYREFQNFRSKSLLFRKSNHQLIDILIKAVKNIQPIQVERSIADLLKHDSSVSPVNCDIQCCKKFLAQTPVLSESKNRVQLLKELLKK